MAAARGARNVALRGAIVYRNYLEDYLPPLSNPMCGKGVRPATECLPKKSIMCRVKASRFANHLFDEPRAVHSDRFKQATTDLHMAVD